MKKYLFLLLAACISYTAQAQRILTGKIVDDQHAPLPGVRIYNKQSNAGASSDASGHFRLPLPTRKTMIEFSSIGFVTQTFTIDPTQKSTSVAGISVQHQTDSTIDIVVQLAPATASLDEVMVTGYAASAAPLGVMKSRTYYRAAPEDNEEYGSINENRYHTTQDQPLSTFSIDVDRASYSNVRRFLNDGAMPPADAVRVEEMINYFDYQYKDPTGTNPVAVYTDMASCPWLADHRLVRIALKAKDMPTAQLPPSNLVFLLDVSGSMLSENKLPLVKKALTMLVSQLRPQDKVAIVVYAGAAGLALPSTPGSEKKTITDALDKLEAGGSTAGGAGIELAYKTAVENFLPDGNNRVILATDGDFNVGTSSENNLEKLITEEREKGISLSVLGFGMGNLKDRKLEMLADKGNGNYGYIDNFEEARRTFVTEFGGTLFTLAKDVKLQVEFNPRYIKAYRLVGYENRMLENEDFNDDQKDAGDMGAGQTVTALYEIIPAGSTLAVNWVDTLKYQQTAPLVNHFEGEALTVKLRYKTPQGKKSQLITRTQPWQDQDIRNAPKDFRMATAVAAFGLLLRNSAYKGSATYTTVLDLAKDARGEDAEGYRAEFMQLVKKAALLDNKAVAASDKE